MNSNKKLERIHKILTSYDVKQIFKTKITEYNLNHFKKDLLEDSQDNNEIPIFFQMNWFIKIAMTHTVVC